MALEGEQGAQEEGAAAAAVEEAEEAAAVAGLVMKGEGTGEVPRHRTWEHVWMFRAEVGVRVRRVGAALCRGRQTSPKSP